jgi:hypothetical protein
MKTGQDPEQSQARLLRLHDQLHHPNQLLETMHFEQCPLPFVYSLKNAIKNLPQ